MKDEDTINIGDLVKKTVEPGKGKLGIVVELGERQGDSYLSNWVRLHYVVNWGYEWVQKCSFQIITKH